MKVKFDPILNKIRKSDKLVFDVMDYGAVGDDSTDNLVAINATMLAANNAGGGIVYFPIGTFQISAVIDTLYSNITFRGQGEKSVLKLKNGANSQMFSNVTTSLSDIHFENISIDGNDANQTNGAGRDDRAIMFLNNISNFSVIKCFIHNCRSGASIRLSNCHQILYQGNKFYNNGMLSSLTADHTYTSNSSFYRVIGNLFDSCTDTGTAQDGVTESIVTGNNYYNCQGNAVSVCNSQTSTSSKNNVSNNIIDGGSVVLVASGIRVGNFGNPGTISDVEIIGNIINNCDRAIWVDDVLRITITSNHLLTNYGNNRQLLLLGGNSNITDITILGNTFYNTNNRGISFDGADGTVVKAVILNNKFITCSTPIGGTLPTDAIIFNNQGYAYSNLAKSVGIGTLAPATDLHVVNEAENSEIRAESKTTTDSKAIVQAVGNNTNGRGVIIASGAHDGFNGTQNGDGPAMIQMIANNQAANPLKMFWSLANGTKMMKLDVVNDGSGGSITALIKFLATGETVLGGVFLPIQHATAGAPAYVKGGIYFNTTLNKLMIGGATAWEVLTSI